MSENKTAKSATWQVIFFFVEVIFIIGFFTNYFFCTRYYRVFHISVSWREKLYNNEVVFHRILNESKSEVSWSLLNILADLNNAFG